MSYTCDKCGKEFEQPIMVDSGGEYGGLPHTYPVSQCCESDFEEAETSTSHENGNDANRLLAEVVEPLIKCTRCRHKHTEKDRIKVKRKKSIWFDMVCPKCNGRAFTYFR